MYVGVDGKYLVICGDHPSALPAAVVLHRPDATDAVVHELAPDEGYHFSQQFAIILSSAFFHLSVYHIMFMHHQRGDDAALA